MLSGDPSHDITNSCNIFKSEGVVYTKEIICDGYTIIHSVEDGIERAHYKPHTKIHEMPVLFQHGMWHDLQCWKYWQAFFARLGYENVSYSLPGHGKSPVQRKVAECTLGYYVYFLNQEINRFENTPIVMAHSMGGAIAQWYLKYIADLPKVIFVASWTAHDILKDSLKSAMSVDPFGTIMSPFWGVKFQFRNDDLVRRWFLSKDGANQANWLRDTLGEESELVLMQQRPPKWTPPAPTSSPKLWLCAEVDAIIPVAASQTAADHYEADFKLVENAGHNLMIDHNWQNTAQFVANWIDK